MLSINACARKVWFLLLSGRNHMSGGSLVRRDANIISEERGWRIQHFLRINRVSGHQLPVHIFGPSPWSENGMRWFSQRPLCHFPCVSSHRRWELSPQPVSWLPGSRHRNGSKYRSDAEGCWFPETTAHLPWGASSHSFPVHSFHVWLVGL